MATGEIAARIPSVSPQGLPENGDGEEPKSKTKVKKARTSRSTSELSKATQHGEHGKGDHVHISGDDMVNTLKKITHALTEMQMAMQAMKRTIHQTDVEVRDVRTKIKTQGHTVYCLKKRVDVLEGAGSIPARRSTRRSSRSLPRNESTTTLERPDSSPRGPARAAPQDLEATPPAVPPCCDERLAALGLNLLKAAQSGRVSDVLRLLAAGADPNFTYASKWTPLHRAASKAHAGIVSLLLDHNACVNATTCYGLTPLHIAAYHDFSGRCVKLLIEARADFCCRDRHGWTPLHYAAESGNLVAVRALRAAGASQNAKDNKGKTPFDVTKTTCIKKLIRSCSRGEWAHSYVCRLKRKKKQQQQAATQTGPQQTAP